MISEDDLIARFFAPIAGQGGLGLRDDAALVAISPDEELVVTADALAAGVHFFADDPPESIARKALRVNLSDLAAKGATPSGFLLSLALPKDWHEDWLTEFANALAKDARDFACPLLGGDTIRSPGELFLSITALGAVPRGKMVRRDGARAADRIYVSGTIGDAAAGLTLRRQKGPGLSIDQDGRAFLLDRYLHPRPRLGLAPILRAYATAAMDISDGFAGDLTKMLRVSSVSARIELRHIPLSDAARSALAADPSLHDRLLTGGDDYEILCTVPPHESGSFEAAAKKATIDVTAIGTVEAGHDAPCFLDQDGTKKTFARGSFSHF
ncbi:MAG: thiamine-monophosphate kinase [Methylobacteriaceae bacterium]|jgi:thiamine-monophosphate kinase|nr:thiamine-monophosphate kinase [Methylobacteriaceae bacterium]